MNREEYLKELSKYLKNLPGKDFEDAMNYFEEYFDDVGTEGEGDLIKELGSPRTVATEILSNLLTEDRPMMERESAEEKDSKEGEKGKKENEENGGKKQSKTRRNFREAGSKNTLGKVALITILCILAAPIGIPLTVALIAVVFSLLVLVLSFILGLGMVSIAGFIGSVKYIISGIIMFHSSIGGAFLVIGIGILMVAFSLLAIFIMASCYKLIVYLLKVLVSKIKKGGGRENELY